MTVIRAFSEKIWAFFLNFPKWAGETYPHPSPSSYAPDTMFLCLSYSMNVKFLVAAYENKMLMLPNK